MLTRRTAVAVMAAAAAGVRSAAAQTPAQFPNRAIQFVLHVSPGGATDIMARRLGVGLEKLLGQPIVVDNRAGGRGAAQLAELAKGRPDGHVIGAVTPTHLAAFHSTLKQYSVDSFDWIARLVSEPYLFVVHAGSDVRTMQDLIRAMRERRGQFIVTGFARGSGHHVAWEIFLDAAGLAARNTARWVPHDSVAAGVTALLGRHGEATVANVDLVREHVAAGSLRVIGVLAEQRIGAMPDVPTLREQGLNADPSWQQFRGVMGPKGMPVEIKARIADALKRVMEAEDFARYMQEAALQNAFAGPAEFQAYAREQDRLTKDWLDKLAVSR